MIEVGTRVQIEDYGPFQGFTGIVLFTVHEEVPDHRGGKHMPGLWWVFPEGREGSDYKFGARDPIWPCLERELIPL